MLIGWASTDITPDRPVCLRGQFHVRISQGVNDPLTATALAIEASDGSGGSDQAIMVSCDHVGLSHEFGEKLREMVRPRLPGFDVRKIFLNATHTHTGPTVTEGKYPDQGPDVMTPTECAELLHGRIADCIVEAWEGRKPGGVTWAFGQAVVGHNRRAVYSDGSAKMYGNTNDERFDSIEGYEDHSLNVLFVWDENQDLTGMVINLACPSQVTEGAYYVSADFWHEVREEIRKRHGRHLFFLPQCAPAGDQSPHFLIHKKEEAYMRERMGLSEREVIGRKVANAVDELLASVRSDIRTDVILKHIVQDIDLPVRLVTEQEMKQARAEYERLAESQPENDKVASQKFTRMNWHRRVIERYERQKGNPGHTIEIHVLRLGDVAIATNPFELFLDFGIRIKARTKALQNFLVQLACGVDGYLPTARAVRARSYGAEPASNLVGPEGGQALVDTTVDLISGLWP